MGACGGNCKCKSSLGEYENILLPWNRPELEGWSIVGMNHYTIQDIRHLYCAMTKDNTCIVSNGVNEIAVFEDLAQQAVSIMG